MPSTCSLYSLLASGTVEDSTLRSSVASTSFSTFLFRTLINKTITIRFERELEALRKELAETAASRSGAATPIDRDHNEGHSHMGLHSRNVSELTLSESNTSESPVLVPKDMTAASDSGVPSSIEQSVNNEPKKER